MKKNLYMLTILATCIPVASAQTVFVPYTGNSNASSTSNAPIVIHQPITPSRQNYAPAPAVEQPVIGLKPGMPGVPDMVAVSASGTAYSNNAPSGYDPNAAYMGGGMIGNVISRPVIQDKALPDNGYNPATTPQTSDFWKTTRNANHAYTPNSAQSIVTDKNSGNLSIISWDFNQEPLMFATHQIRFTLRSTYAKTIYQINAKVQFQNVQTGQTYTMPIQKTLNLSPNEIMTLDGTSPSGLNDIPKNVLQANLIINNITFMDQTMLNNPN